MRCDVNSAEMIKLAANALLMTRISFINEIANVCEATGADVVKVAEGVGLDRRLGPHFLRAGIGYGGSCFPKDSLALKQLASNSGYHFQLLSAVIEVNELQKRRVIEKLEAPPRLAARQEDRAARAGVQAEHRRHARGAVDRARGPAARRGRRGARLGPGRRRRRRCRAASRSSARSLEAVRGADAAVIVTEWAELRELASAEMREAMANPLIIDGRNLLDPAAVARSRVRVRGDRPAGLRRRAESVEVRLDGGDHPRRWQGGAARRCRRRPAEVARRRRRHGRSRPTRSARLAQAGVDRVIISCAAGQGDALRARARRARRRDRRRRGARAVRPRRRDQVRGRQPPRGRRRLRAERRRARRGRLRGAARAPPGGRRRRDGRRRAAEVAVRGRRARRGRRDRGVQRGRRDPLLGQLRHLRPLATRRSSDSRSAATTRRRRFPELVAERRLFAYRHDGPLAHREHAEGAPRCGRPRRRAPGVARVRRRAMSVDWPNSARSTVGVRAAPRREAVGVRADLGAQRRLLRQGLVRPRRASRSRSSTTARRTSRG